MDLSLFFEVRMLKQSSLEFEGQHTQHCLIDLGFLYKTSAYCFFQFANRLTPQTDVHA